MAHFVEISIELPKERRTRRREARGETIVAAAHALMAEVGYEAMTMDDLAARAGVSKPTLYQYFPSKEAVVVRAVVGLMQNGVAFMEALDADLPALDRLDRWVRWVVGQRFSRSLFGGVKGALTPVVRAHPEYKREFSRMVAGLSGLVEQAKAEKTIAAHLSTRVVVQMVFSFLRDSEYDVLIASGEVTGREITETLADVFLCGLRLCRPEQSRSDAENTP